MGVGDDVAPRFTQKPALRQEDGGQRLVFQCVLEASPKPDISWFRGTTSLSSSDRLRMRVDSAGGSAYNVIMEILGVTQADAGTYKVTAKNRLGEVSASINLNFSGQLISVLCGLFQFRAVFQSLVSVLFGLYPMMCFSSLPPFPFGLYEWCFS